MTPADSRLQTLIAENERLTLDLAEARHRILALEKLAREDGLTGLLNRRSFDLELQRALEFHVRYGEDMALILIDLDHFKGINDVFGHAGGDAALRHVATILSRHVRGSDIVARIGGDEFALILWRVNAESGARKIALLRAALESQPLVIDGRTVDTGFSAGCAPVAEQDWSLARWFAEADSRLYADKAARRQPDPVRR